MKAGEHARPAAAPGPGQAPDQPPVMRGQRPYLALMGICLFLIVMAWTWVYLLSTTAAIVMSAVGLAIPPFAAIVANAGRETADLREHERERRGRP